MAINQYALSLVLIGFGNDAAAAWEDAVSQFAIEPGPTPDNPTVEPNEED